MQGTLKALIEAVDRELASRGWDYKALSNLLGMNKSNWSRVKQGKRTPSLNMLTLLKQKLPEISGYIDDYINHREIPNRQGQNSPGKKVADKTGGETITPPLKSRKKALTPQLT